MAGSAGKAAALESIAGAAIWVSTFPVTISV